MNLQFDLYTFNIGEARRKGRVTNSYPFVGFFACFWHWYGEAILKLL